MPNHPDMQVLAQISSLERLLAGVRDSPHFGGVMPQFELTEQLLREAAQAVARCKVSRAISQGGCPGCWVEGRGYQSGRSFEVRKREASAH
eukprot:1160828-Pelagomonas_calceolata.AAC.8